MVPYLHELMINLMIYSQLSPCGHLAITDTSIIRTIAKSPAKIDYRHLTEINSCYYGLSLLRTLTHGPEGVDCTVCYINYYNI